MAHGASALAAHKVTVRRGARAVLDTVSLSAHAGKLTVLLGPNGAGKSTLLSVLSGDENPAAGHTTLNGASLHTLSPRARAQHRAVLPQHASLSFDLPVLDVVQMGRTPFGERVATSREIARAALDAVELDATHASSYLRLSGGERQRVQLARFLAQTWPDAPAARVGLLDEPVSSLDPRQQHRTMSVLKSLTRVGCTVVVVLHDLVLASLYADRVVVLREGRVLSHDTPERALSCTVLEAAFDTRFSVRRDSEGLPVVLPCARDDQWRGCDVRCVDGATSSK